MSRMRPSDSPEVPPMSSGPDALKNGRPSSPAMAVARKVLPQPDGPLRSNPHGGCTPKWLAPREHGGGV